MRIMPVLCVLVLALSISSCLPVPAPMTADERSRLLSKAELVFEGKPVSVQAVTGNDSANAMESHGEIRYLVTFNINKIVKGNYNNLSFVIAVHSPATSFRLYPWEVALAKSRLYRVYIDYSSEDRTSIDYEDITASQKI